MTVFDAVMDRACKAFGNCLVRSLTVTGVALGFQLVFKECESDWGYHLGGVFAGLSANAIDHYTTLPVIRLMNSPDFKKNKLENYYRESSILLGSHPSLNTYYRRAALGGALVFALSLNFPVLGLSYLTVCPLIYYNNRQVCRDIKANLFVSRLEEITATASSLSENNASAQ
ncbi:hypothetical protein HY486_03425 [Candidatus Woesearchaeota archaeon]|nr:hypothetical protein [Candidatus Woesearchaeota archaeon]